MKKITTIIICMMLSFALHAQQQPCYFDEGHAIIRQLHPDMVKRWLDADNKASRFTSDDLRTSTSVITIPVVVHVVYHLTSENISDAQIQSQLDVLNEDFRRMNADTSNTRFVFRSVAGDARIEFCMAQRDPNGDSTNGITRTYTTRTDWGCCDSMKYTSEGGQDGWPGNQYLNIWVCNLNFANGYAYYPGTPDPYDGVVVHYYVFGRTGNVAPGYIGRTGTHEMGHYLGLYHTFDYGNCSGADSSDCAAAGDKVCDTPADSFPDYGCLLSANECIDTPVDRPDQIENYLDYSDDNCRNMFSLGQIDRMRGFMFTSRSSLLTSLGCVPPNSLSLDAVAIEFTQPLPLICQTTFTPVVKIGNISAIPFTTIDADYWIDAGTVNTYHSLIPVAPGNISYITLPPVTTTTGVHTMHVALHSPNGGVDLNPSNDSASLVLRILSNANGLSTPFAEGFQSATFPSNGWMIDNPDNDHTWQRTIDAGGFGLSSSSALFQNFYNGGTDTYDGLITPPFNFTALNTAYLNFDVAYCDPNSTFYSDTLKVYSTLDCGSTWNLIYSKGGATLATAPAPLTFSEFVPDSTQWRTENINVSTLISNPLVSFKFENVSYWGNDLYLDNINIFDVTGINELNDGSAIHIFPNPSAGIFTIENTGKETIHSIEVFNSLGETILARQNINARHRSIDISRFSKGVYYIKIILGENTVRRKFLLL